MTNKSKNPVPTEKNIRIEYNLIKDEVEWIKQNTNFYDRFIPFLSNKYFLKIFFSIIIFGFLLLKFFPIFVTIIFSLITSYIKFKRTKVGFGIEIEPSYLFSIVLLLAFGYQYGLFLY